MLAISGSGSRIHALIWLTFSGSSCLCPRKRVCTQIPRAFHAQHLPLRSHTYTQKTTTGPHACTHALTQRERERERQTDRQTDRDRERMEPSSKPLSLWLVISNILLIRQKTTHLVTFVLHLNLTESENKSKTTTKLTQSENRLQQLWPDKVQQHRYRWQDN